MLLSVDVDSIPGVLLGVNDDSADAVTLTLVKKLDVGLITDEDTMEEKVGGDDSVLDANCVAINDVSVDDTDCFDADLVGLLDDSVVVTALVGIEQP